MFRFCLSPGGRSPAAGKMLPGRSPASSPGAERLGWSLIAVVPLLGFLIGAGIDRAERPVRPIAPRQASHPDAVPALPGLSSRLSLGLPQANPAAGLSRPAEPAALAASPDAALRGSSPAPAPQSSGLPRPVEALTVDAYLRWLRLAEAVRFSAPLVPEPLALAADDFAARLQRAQSVREEILRSRPRVPDGWVRLDERYTRALRLELEQIARLREAARSSDPSPGSRVRLAERYAIESALQEADRELKRLCRERGIPCPLDIQPEREPPGHAWEAADPLAASRPPEAAERGGETETERESLSRTFPSLSNAR